MNHRKQYISLLERYIYPHIYYLSDNRKILLSIIISFLFAFGINHLKKITSKYEYFSNCRTGEYLFIEKARIKNIRWNYTKGNDWSKIPIASIGRLDTILFKNNSSKQIVLRGASLSMGISEGSSYLVGQAGDLFIQCKDTLNFKYAILKKDKFSNVPVIEEKISASVYRGVWDSLVTKTHAKEIIVGNVAKGEYLVVKKNYGESYGVGVIKSFIGFDPSSLIKITDSGVLYFLLNSGTKVSYRVFSKKELLKEFALPQSSSNIYPPIRSWEKIIIGENGKGKIFRVNGIKMGGMYGTNFIFINKDKTDFTLVRTNVNKSTTAIDSTIAQSNFNKETIITSPSFRVYNYNRYGAYSTGLHRDEYFYFVNAKPNSVIYYWFTTMERD